MAVSPDASGARYAPCGVTRALVRVAVLGGLIVATWLLVGSGIGHADEDLGPSDTGLLRLVPVPQPAGKLSDLRPVVNAVDVPKLLVPVLSPVSRPLSGPAQRRATIRQAPVSKSVTVPPTVRAAPVPLAGLTPAVLSTAVLTAGSHTPTPIPARAVDHPVADPVTGRSVLDSAPVPVSPPASTTALCLIAGTGGSASTKNGPDLAVLNRGAETGRAPMPHRLGCLGASDLPRSPAEQPSTSPD
ncbi:MAG: hypothetical protein ACRDRU_14810 [Pseudonocardiaceae bacterium]